MTHSPLLMRTAAVVTLLVGRPAFATIPCNETVPVVPAERDMRTHLRQAKHFEKKGWIDDAVREVAMARDTPDGRHDPEVFALTAHLARRQDNIVGARCMADATVRLDRSGAATERARALLRELDRSFGYLTIYSTGDTPTASLRIEPPKMFATPELKAYAERRVSELRDRHPLPIQVALPAGAYVVSGQSITVLPGQYQELTLHPRRTRPAWASPLFRLRMGAAFHPDQPHQPPPAAGTLDLIGTWPVLRGRQSALHAGIRAGGVSGATVGDDLSVPVGGDLGVQLSGIWSADIGLDLHADASVGWASQSGIGWACPLDGSACTTTPPEGMPTDLLMQRDQGLQLRGGGGLDLRGLGKAEALGIGLDVAVVRTSGTLDPTTGTTDGLGWSVGTGEWSTLAVAPALSVSVRR